MSIVTGLGLAILIMILGALGMTLLGVYLANRDKDSRAAQATIAITRGDVLQLIRSIENLQPIREKLRMLIEDERGTSDL